MAGGRAVLEAPIGGPRTRSRWRTSRRDGCAGSDRHWKRRGRDGWKRIGVSCSGCNCGAWANLDELDAVSAQVGGEIGARLLRFVAADQRLMMMMMIPGVGLRTAQTVLAEPDPSRRHRHRELQGTRPPGKRSPGLTGPKPRWRHQRSHHRQIDKTTRLDYGQCPAGGNRSIRIAS